MAAISLIAHVSRATAGATSSIDTTGANFIVAVQGWTTVSSVNTSFSDSKSNVWLPVAVSHAANAQNTASLAIYIAQGSGISVGSSHTFTVGAGSASACIAAFSNVNTYTPIGVGKLATSSGATSLQPAAITPSRDNSLMIAALSYRDTTTVSIDGSFSISDQVAFSSGVNIGTALAYLIQTTAASANPTLSWTNSVICNAVLLEISPLVSYTGFMIQ